jgi:DNA recombination protein RmuC
MNRTLEEMSTFFLSPKGRGHFGELHLENLIRKITFPLGSSYDFQVTLSNRKRVDCLIRLPSPIGNLCVDSKFPLDAFRQQQEQQQPSSAGMSHNMMNGTYLNGGNVMKNGETMTTAATDNNNNVTRKTKLQRDSLLKHIHDISSKYILPGETADFAILYVPSESIFHQIVNDHPDIVLEGHRRKVWIACPTTFMAVLTTLQGVTTGVTLEQQTTEAMGHVHKLMQDVGRLNERYKKAEKSIDDAKESLRQMNISMEKIGKTWDSLEAMGLSLGERKQSSGRPASVNQRIERDNGQDDGEDSLGPHPPKSTDEKQPKE